jgi:hypothetical protein
METTLNTVSGAVETRIVDIAQRPSNHITEADMTEARQRAGFGLVPMVQEARPEEAIGEFLMDEPNDEEDVDF